MSDKANQDGRNPFEKAEGQTSGVIKGLVATAFDTRRQAEQESEADGRYPSQINRKERRISFDLDPEVKDELKALAAEVASSRQLSAVTQALIVYALKGCQEGRLKLEPQLNFGAVGFVVVEAKDNAE